MAHKLLFEPPLVLLKYDNDAQIAANRGINGLLKYPPRVFVLSGDEEQDSVVIHEVPWAAAFTLAPGAMNRLAKQLRDARDGEAVAAEEARRAQAEAKGDGHTFPAPVAAA